MSMVTISVLRQTHQGIQFVILAFLKVLYLESRQIPHRCNTPLLVPVLSQWQGFDMAPFVAFGVNHHLRWAHWGLCCQVLSSWQDSEPEELNCQICWMGRWVTLRSMGVFQEPFKVPTSCSSKVDDCANFLQWSKACYHSYDRYGHGRYLEEQNEWGGPRFVWGDGAQPLSMVQREGLTQEG